MRGQETAGKQFPVQRAKRGRGNHFIRSCGLVNRFVKAIEETNFTINYPLMKHALFWDFYARQNGSLLQTFRDNLWTPHAAQKSLQSMTLQKRVHP